MSADNILIILYSKKKIRVYDVNFSEISCHSDWMFPLTAEKSERLTQYIIDSPINHELHKCETVEQAEGFCRRYARDNVVGYGKSSIVYWPDGKPPHRKDHRRVKREKGKKVRNEH